MGNGVIRPATTFRAYDGSGRLGVDLSTSWRIDGHVNVYRGRDINTPGDVFSLERCTTPTSKGTSAT
jgi:hypothetical protein